LVAPMALSTPICGCARRRDEHDVDDADGSEAKGYDADAAEKDIHCIKDGADELFLLNVSNSSNASLRRIFEWIEVVPLADHLVDGGDGLGAVPCGGVIGDAVSASRATLSPL